jgi:hypothetical protein
MAQCLPYRWIFLVLSIPTDRAHLVRFILLSNGRLSVLRRSCAILRQTAMGERRDGAFDGTFFGPWRSVLHEDDTRDEKHAAHILLKVEPSLRPTDIVHGRGCSNEFLSRFRCGRCADLHDRSRFARWRLGGGVTAVEARCVQIECGTAKMIASRSDLAMSGLADCGRESGHGNIDASDPD